MCFHQVEVKVRYVQRDPGLYWRGPRVAGRACLQVHPAVSHITLKGMSRGGGVAFVPAAVRATVRTVLGTAKSLCR